MWALLWPLFARSPRAQPAIVVAGMTGEDAALASIRSVGVGSVNHCGASQECLGRFSGP